VSAIDRCEAIRRASRVVGDPSRLRLLLGVREDTLAHWIDGRGDPPVSAFLRAVDIIEGGAAFG